MEKTEEEAPKPGPRMLMGSVANLLPVTAEAWRPIFLALRSSFLSALALFSGLLLAAYALWAGALYLIPDEIPEAFVLVASLAAMSVGAIYGGSFGVTRTDSMGPLSVETNISMVAFPSLLTILVIVVAVLTAQRQLRAIAAHRVVSLALVPLSFALTSVILVWGLGFITNRYAVLPYDSELAGFSVSTLSGGGALVAGAIIYVPSVIAGALLLAPNGAFAMMISWFLRTFRTFLFLFLTVGIAAVAVYVVYNLIDVEFGAVSTVEPVSDTDWVAILTASALVLFLLPTIVLNALWIVSGSPVGIQLDAANQMAISDWLPSEVLDEVFLSLDDYSLWDDNPWMSVGFLFGLLIIALFSGATSANYSRFIPRSFWSLAVLAGLSVVSGLILRGFSSIQGSVGARLDGDIPETVDPSQYLAEFGFSGVSIFWGVSELAAIALMLGLVISAFFGAKYLATWIPGVFPRFGATLSLQKADPTLVKGQSAGQRWAARAIIVVGAGAAVVALSLATAERVFAIVESPERYVQNLAQGLVSDSVEERKKVFGDTGIYEWLPDAAFPQSDHPFRDGFEITVAGSGGGEWAPGELVTTATITSLGDQKVRFSFPVVAEVEEYPLGFNRAVFVGSPRAPVIGLELPAVLAEAGVTDLQVGGISVIPGKYFVLPGTYEVASEGQGVVSSTTQTIALGQGLLDVTVEPVVSLPPEINRELTGRLDQILEDCSDFDSRGASDCFSVQGEGENSESLEGPPPTDYFDFVQSGDFEIDFLGCEEPADNLDSAFSLTRTQRCSWNVEAERTYFDTRVIRTPIYETRYKDTFILQCNERYDSTLEQYGLGFYYWEGCWRSDPIQVQTGTSTSYARGSEVFRAVFRSAVSIRMSVTAEYLNGVLQVGEPNFVRE